MKECNYPQQTTYGKMKPGIAPYISHFLKWKKELRGGKNGKREMKLCTTKGRKQMKKKRSEVWEMKQEHKQARKATERHIVIKGKNKQINQDMIEWKLNCTNGFPVTFPTSCYNILLIL